METRPRNCPLCSEASEVLFAESNIDEKRLNEFAYASRKIPEYMHHRLLLCERCDIVYASPIPAPTELEAGYQDAAYDSQVEAMYAAKTYASQIQNVCKKLPDRIGALDIGAGDGAFCDELQTIGFTDVVGLEPSSAPIAVAKPSVKDCLRQEMFVEGLFSAERFALITCFQTIEHVSEPMALCQEAARLLKPGGAFCIVAHNRRSVSCRMLGRKSPIFDIEHLQLFSPISLRRLLTNAGLKDITVKPLFNCYPVAYWMKLFPFPLKLKTTLINGLQTTGIGRIPVMIPAGNLVAWGFR